MLGGEEYTRIELRDSAGSVIEDFFELTVEEEEQIHVGWLKKLDCPDKHLDNKTTKRFVSGRKVKITIAYLAHDWDSTTSDDGRTLQEFLVDMENHTGVIRIKPHTDKSNTYDVLTQGDFEPEYAFQRWKGWKGVLLFIGDEILSEIDIAP